MDTITINLKGPTIPTGDPSRIHYDPIFCSACLNLHNISAQAMALEPSVHTGFDRITDEYLEKQLRETVGEDLYAERARLEGDRSDFPPNRVDTPLVDIAGAAKTGCETCAMLQAVVTKMGGKDVSFADPDQAAIITFTREVALRVRIWRVDNPADNDSSSDDDGIFYPGMGGRRRVLGRLVDQIASLELYSLRGKADFSSVPPTSLIATL